MEHEARPETLTASTKVRSSGRNPKSDVCGFPPQVDRRDEASCDLCRRFGFVPQVERLAAHFSVLDDDLAADLVLLTAPWFVHQQGRDPEPAARLALETVSARAAWAEQNGRESQFEALQAAADDLDRLLHSPLDLNHTALQMVWDRLSPALREMVGADGSPADGSEGTVPGDDAYCVEVNQIENLNERISGLFVLGDWLQAVGSRMAADRKLRDVVEELHQINRELKIQSEALQQDIFALQTESGQSIFPGLCQTAVRTAAGQGFRLDVHCDAAPLEIDRRASDDFRHAAERVIEFLLADCEAPSEAGGAAATPSADVVLFEINVESSRGQTVTRFQRAGLAIDPDRVRQQAVAHGLLSVEDSAGLSDQESLGLLLRPGMDWPGTESAGYRGPLRLHEAAAFLARHEGRLGIGTDEAGTWLSLELPRLQGTTTIDALLVAQCGQLFLIPFEYVCEATRIPLDGLRRVQNRPMVLVQGSWHMAACLEGVLGLEPSMGQGEPAAAERPGVLVQTGERTAVILLEEIVGHRKAVVRPLKRILPGTCGDVAGVAPLDQGRLALVLDIPSLLNRLASP